MSVPVDRIADLVAVFPVRPRGVAVAVAQLSKIPGDGPRFVAAQQDGLAVARGKP